MLLKWNLDALFREKKNKKKEPNTCYHPNKRLKWLSYQKCTSPPLSSENMGAISVVLEEQK